MNWLSRKPEEVPALPVKPKLDEAFKGQSMIDFVSPFKKESLQSVWFLIRKDWEGAIVMEAWVNYKNTSSEGKHTVTADTFQGLVDKINEFINGMAS